MAYIDETFYKSMSSVDIPQDEFGPIAEQASDIIDALTFRAVERFDLQEGNPLFTRVKRAVAYQCEFIMRSFGSLDAWANAAADDVGSESIGNYSYSKKGDAGGSTRYVNGLMVAPTISNVLAPVVALGRRVG